MITKHICKTHEEWLDLRHRYIGGSDAGTLVGLNPYKSPLGLWAEKTDKVEPFAGNIVTRCGTLLEPLVAELFTEATGKKVRNDNATIFNDKYPYSCANIDRKIVGEKAFLECKTTTSFSIMKQLRNGKEFPVAYYCQCMHYLAITGFTRCYLAVLENCRELHVYTLERDEDEIEALMQAEREFWVNYVIADKQPPADASSNAAAILAELYPQGDPDIETDLMPCAAEIKAYMAAKENKAAIDKEIKQAENSIKQYMGNATKGTCADYVATWRADKNGTRRFTLKQTNN